MVQHSKRRTIVVVGSGNVYLSGISYYTYYLVKALTDHAPIQAIVIRKSVPRFLYPGRRRAGAAITDLKVSSIAPTFDGIEWYGLPSIIGAVRFLRRAEPKCVILEWWTTTVLPWYLILAVSCRLAGIPVILELHEVGDTAELRVPVLAAIAKSGLRVLAALSDHLVVHSEFDRTVIARTLNCSKDKFTVIEHGPYPMAVPPSNADHVDSSRVTELLYFGTIRPYKGVEYLVDAFHYLVDAYPQIEWRLRIVGEPWQGWSAPFDRIEASQYRDKIEIIPRYVRDEELPSIFATASVVVLPYIRSSASGPLHLAMSAGRRVVVSAVGGLTAVASQYRGAVMVEPENAKAIAEGILQSMTLHPPFADPFSWSAVADRMVNVVNAVARRESE